MAILYLSLPAAAITELQVVQNDAARLNAKLPRRAHASPVLQDLHCWPVLQRIQFKVLCLIFKAVYKLAPAFVKSRLVFYTPSRILRSSSAELLIVPRVRKARMGGHSFAVLGPELWNDLPASFSLENNYLLFWKKLKALLFTQAWRQ